VESTSTEASWTCSVMFPTRKSSRSTGPVQFSDYALRRRSVKITLKRLALRR